MRTGLRGSSTRTRARVGSFLDARSRRTRRVAMIDQGYAGSNPQVPASLPEIKMAYRGEGGDLFFIVLKNVFLTLITLGIYSAWGKTARRAYMWKQVDIGGERLEYTGTGRELFRGYLKVALGYMVLFV